MNELIESAQKGDELSIKLIIDKYNDSVKYITKQFIEDDADIIQTIWINAINKLKYFKSGSFKDWLQRLSKNVCIDNYRKLKSKKNIELIYQIDDNIEYEQYDKTIDDKLNFIYNNLNKLSENEINVVVLRLNRFKYDDISKILKLPKNTCLHHYHTSIKKFKKLINGTYTFNN